MLTEKELEAIKPHLPTADAEKATLETGAALMVAQVIALSTLAMEQAEELKKAETKSLDRLQIDPDTLEMSVDLTETKLSTLVKEGAITPAVSKALSAALVGPADARNVYALSRKATGGTKPLATLVLDALKDNKPVKLGEKTGSQQKVLELSRSEDQASETEYKAMQETMLNAANRGRR